MNIIVDKLPSSCDECMFMKYDNLYRYCRAIDNVVEKVDEYGHRLYGYKDMRCPLISINESLLNIFFKDGEYHEI